MALVGLALCALMALLRGRIGDVAGWPQGRSLRLFSLRTLPNFQPRASLRPVASGWGETFLAFPTLLGEWCQALEPRGLVWLWAWLVLGLLAWWGVALWRGWRRPSPLFGALLGLQLLGAAFYLVSFRSPARRLETPFFAFDFHVHTTRSNGLLTPQQQIDWHRARGFKGLAFTDSNRAMPEAQLDALRRANPDLLLLNGCEYHGRAHLLILGATRDVSAKVLSVGEAVREGKRQGALVIAAHPWSPGKESSQQLLQAGVDGFEAWNGQVWSREVLQLVQKRNLAATTGTDTLSKSGARCFTWTIAPRGLDKPGDVLRALRLRKVSGAVALSGEDTPQAWEQRQSGLRRPWAVFPTLGQAWHTLSRAQKWSALFGFLTATALLGAWGMVPPQRSTGPQGPKRALSYLKRRRLGPRAAGVLMMAGAFAASIEAAIVTMGGSLKDAAWAQGLTPLHAIAVWVVCDALFWWGRTLWQRTA